MAEKKTTAVKDKVENAFDGLIPVAGGSATAAHLPEHVLDGYCWFMVIFMGIMGRPTCWGL